MESSQQGAWARCQRLSPMRHGYPLSMIWAAPPAHVVPVMPIAPPGPNVEKAMATCSELAIRRWPRGDTHVHILILVLIFVIVTRLAGYTAADTITLVLGTGLAGVQLARPALA